MAFGANESRLFGQDLGTSVSVTTNVYTSGVLYKDVVWHNSSYTSTVGNTFSRIAPTSGIAWSASYDYGPLNGQCLLRDSYYFVGTDHGIFRSDLTNDILEWQPSSSSHSIVAINKDNTNSNLYATGANGVVLRSNDNGGIPFPYAGFTVVGGCVNNNYFFYGNSGPNVSNNWYIDGTYLNSSSGNTAYLFTTAGTYEVMLTASKGGMIDTFIVNVVVVEVL